jgi:hypothetical protein
MVHVFRAAVSFLFSVQLVPFQLRSPSLGIQVRRNFTSASTLRTICMTKDQLKELETNLWAAADNLRANSDLKSSEYWRCAITRRGRKAGRKCRCSRRINCSGCSMWRSPKASRPAASKGCESMIFQRERMCLRTCTARAKVGSGRRSARDGSGPVQPGRSQFGFRNPLAHARSGYVCERFSQGNGKIFCFLVESEPAFDSHGDVRGIVPLLAHEIPPHLISHLVLIGGVRNFTGERQ